MKTVCRRLFLGLMCALALGCSNTTVDCPSGQEYNFDLAECKVPCPTGQLHCDGACVDIVSGADNCGTCGNTCPAGGACNAGRCACPAGMVVCDETCVDLSSDLAHCGACGDACIAGGLCSDGQCACPTGASTCTDSTVYAVQGVPIDVEPLYGVNETQEWTVTAPASATEIRLRFESLSTGGDTDWVAVLRGDEVLAQYAGELEQLGEGSSELGGPEGGWTEWFAAAEIVVRFTTDDRFSRGGFTISEAEARPLPPPEYCSDLTTDPFNCGACRSACPDGSVCIDSQCGCPDGGVVCDTWAPVMGLPITVPARYPAQQDERWTLTAPEGAERMRLHFERLATEECCDFVTILDAEGNQLDRFSGQLFDHWTDWYETAEVTVRFTSDLYDSGDGFVIDDMEYDPYVGGGAPVCAVLDEDNGNCGGCGIACPPDSQCVGGVCECPEGLSPCGGECVDLTTSHGHCGACDNRCGDGYCTASQCSTVTQMQVASAHYAETYCVLMSDGKVICWGEGDNENYAPYRVSTGLPVTRLFKYGGAYDQEWFCGIRTDEQVVCWGAAYTFYVGRRDATGTLRTYAGRREMDDMLAYLVGDRDYAACGNNDTEVFCDEAPGAPRGTAMFSFVYGGAGSVPCVMTLEDTVQCFVEGSWQPVEGFEVFDAVASNTAFACYLRNGDAFCVGEGDAGQLGDASGSDSSTPVQAFRRGMTLGSIFVGPNYACGLSSETSEAFCWGSNASGQFGDGTMNTSQIPVPAVTGIPLTTMGLGDKTACGYGTDRRIYCWGYGYGPEPRRAVPVGAFAQLGGEGPQSPALVVEDGIAEGSMTGQINRVNVSECRCDSVDAIGLDVIIPFRSSADGLVVLTANVEEGRLSVGEAADGSSVSIAGSSEGQCSAGRLDFNVLAGRTYYAVIDHCGDDPLPTEAMYQLNIEGLAPPECTQDDACASGDRCLHGLCLGSDECVYDEDCGAARRCDRTFRCIDRPAGPQGLPIVLPGPYAPNLNLSWPVSAPGASEIRLHFAEVDLESCCDSVTFRNADGQRIGDTISGTRTDFWTEWLPANELTVKFSSSRRGSGGGFLIDAGEIR